MNVFPKDFNELIRSTVDLIFHASDILVRADGSEHLALSFVRICPDESLSGEGSDDEDLR